MSNQVDVWRTELQLDRLLTYPQVWAMIMEACREAKPPLQPEWFLGLSGGTAAPGAPVTEAVMGLFNAVGEAYQSLPIGTRRSQTTSCARPGGEVIVSVLCSLARRRNRIRRAWPQPGGCVIEAEIPANWLTWQGVVTVGVTQRGAETFVTVGAHIGGQLYDWGRGKRIVRAVLADVQRGVLVGPGPS